MNKRDIRFYKLLIVLLVLFICQSYTSQCPNNLVVKPIQEDFKILVQRTENIGDTLITGIIYLNGEAIGKTYENKDYLVKAGKYNGFIRYYSKKGFAQGPLGTIGNIGDFLIEIADAVAEDGKTKTNVLLHTGFLPKHSLGCILLGPALGPKGSRYIADDSPLRKLRLSFYGTEFPNSSPDKNIQIEIVDNY